MRSMRVGAVALSTLVATVSAENSPISEPDCDSSVLVNIRYAATTKRLYLEAENAGTRGGCVTLTDIFEARGGKGPLYAFDPDTNSRVEEPTGTWLLTEGLFVEDGITLQVHGGSGGDADMLLLLSEDDYFLNLRGHGGSLSFHNTKVFSWDEGAGTYDTDYSNGRSYISVVSEVIVDPDEDCDGHAKNDMGEARMDIVSSEIGYLGYLASESYGLTWKVRGFCTENQSNLEIFDQVNVYGNIYDSDIHHNYFGMYTYGHQQGDWRRNKMHDNIEYGFDPHDDSDYLNIHDNEVYRNGNHGIIASKRCNDVSIQNNEVYDGGNAGLFLHRSSDNAIVKNNLVYDNADAGLAMMESFNANVRRNKFKRNKYGIRLSVGCADNVFRRNVIRKSTKYNFYTYEGTDKPDVADTGRPQNNKFIKNKSFKGEEAIKLTDADGTIFRQNEFKSADVIRFEDSTEIRMVDNTMDGEVGLGDVVELKVTNSCFHEKSDEDFEPVC